MKKGSILSLTVAVAIISGCATTEVAPAAANVRTINEQQSTSCEFIDSVSTNNMNTLTKYPEQDAKNRALNRVNELGGNALLVKSTSQSIAPSGVGSIVHLAGEAYRCE